MEVSSSTAVIPATAEILKGDALVAARALLPITSTQSQICSPTFAADINSAEKGTGNTTATIPLEIKRSSARKTSDDPAPLLEGVEKRIEETEAVSTGANQYAQVLKAVEGAIKELSDPETPSLPILINPPTNTSTSTSSSNDTLVGTENTTERQDREGEPNATDTGLHRIVERNYETYPLGWPQLAAFLNSADNYAIFRRFGTAHCRVLLHLMAEITSIQKELDALDQCDAEDKGMLYRLRRNEWYEGWDTAQKDLLDKLRAKLLEYGAILLQDSKLRELDRTPSHDWQHVFRWLYDRKPLDDGEYDFILHRDDFVSSGRGSQNPFERLIESYLSRWPNARFRRLLGEKNEVHGTQDPAVHFFSSVKIAFVGRLAAVCVAVTILLIPIFLLYLTQMSRRAVSGMLLAFVLAFATLISLFTSSGAETVFVSTCAYCAVLVTFMGNVQIDVVSVT